MHVVDDGGLQPRERQVESVAEHRTGEGDRRRVTARRGLLDRRTARVAEAEETGDLVERLPRGVVDRLAEHRVGPRTCHLDDQAVAARHEDDDRREPDFRVLEQRGVEVALEVVDPDVGDPPRHRERLGEGHADEERADETRSRRRGDGGDGRRRRRAETSCPERLRDDRDDPREVGPSRELGDDAAEVSVQVDLARDDRGANLPAVGDDGGGGLVARGLHGEDEPGHRRRPGVGPAGSPSVRAMAARCAP